MNKINNERINDFLRLIKTLLIFITEDSFDSYNLELIKNKVSVRTQILPSHLERSISKLFSQRRDLYSLTNKHYLLNTFIRYEISPGEDISLFYILIGLLSNHKLRFGSFEEKTLFKDIKDKYYINTLRLIRPDIERYVLYLSNRQDETYYRLDRDHAMISTFALIYVLCIFSTIVRYENTVNPEPSLTDLLSIILETLVSLKKGA